MIDSLYRDQPSLLHSYDCRLKLLLLPLLVIYYFLPLPFVSAAGFTLLLLIITFLDLGSKDMIMPVKMILPLLILIFLLTPLFHKSGDVLISSGSFILVTSHGLIEAVGYVNRLLGITTLFFMIFRTTPMEDLLLGLAWFRLPYLVTLVISITLRYIPHLAGLYGQIRAAHALRCGIHDESVSSKGPGRVKSFFPILVSLMIQSVKTIPVLAMALELKGIGRDNPRTRLRVLPPFQSGGIQIICTILLLAFLVLPLVVFR